MSLRIAALLVPLFIFPAFVFAQVVAPNCNSTTWQWTANSLGQDPCTVVAYMMSTCNGGQYSLWPLQPTWVYFGPSGTDNSDLCECSTVGYSLFSACAACQEQDWITWSEWVTNCTKIMPPSSFPNPVPSQIRVPQWALLDVTSENDWNASKSYSVGDSPEVSPGTFIGSSVNGNSNTGAIVGGVVGGVAGISIIAAVIFFYLRRRRSRARSAATPGFGASQPPIDETKQPLTEEGINTVSSLPGTSSMPGTPGAPMRLYDPNDPTTFPGALQPPAGPVPSQNGTGNTMQTSRPQGYHGLPAV
ncbi:hypothetical protein BGY98DRAFT_44273 [Russula aff. rugulosa BPL654]|nr:hypothetical protein BGY98DRAFT_44273 [Russula aff. rugulosa BPL654]